MGKYKYFVGNIDNRIHIIMYDTKTNTLQTSEIKELKGYSLITASNTLRYLQIINGHPIYYNCVLVLAVKENIMKYYYLKIRNIKQYELEQLNIETNTLDNIYDISIIITINDSPGIIICNIYDIYEKNKIYTIVVQEYKIVTDNKMEIYKNGTIDVYDDIHNYILNITSRKWNYMVMLKNNELLVHVRFSNQNSAIKMEYNYNITHMACIGHNILGINNDGTMINYNIKNHKHKLIYPHKDNLNKKIEPSNIKHICCLTGNIFIIYCSPKNNYYCCITKEGNDRLYKLIQCGESEIYVNINGILFSNNGIHNICNKNIIEKQCCMKIHQINNSIMFNKWTREINKYIDSRDISKRIETIIKSNKLLEQYKIPKYIINDIIEQVIGNVKIKKLFIN